MLTMLFYCTIFFLLKMSEKHSNPTLKLGFPPFIHFTISIISSNKHSLEKRKKKKKSLKPEAIVNGNGYGWINYWLAQSRNLYIRASRPHSPMGHFTPFTNTHICATLINDNPFLFIYILVNYTCIKIWTQDLILHPIIMGGQSSIWAGAYWHQTNHPSFIKLVPL